MIICFWHCVSASYDREILIVIRRLASSRGTRRRERKIEWLASYCDVSDY